MKLVIDRALSLAFFPLLCALGTGCGAAEGSATESADLALSSGLDVAARKVLPALPDPSLAVPAGNNLAFSFDGVGVQIYACQATATGTAWVFQAPQATLFDRGKAVGKHFAGPTWEFKDGSTVVGAKIASFTVDPTAIPWLLLQATSHTGNGRMSDVSYVQRLQTTGGNAPATGCDADHVGDITQVDYTAKYFFYRSTDGG